MSISITRYVSITSGVGAGTVVPTRELVARIFTANDLLPPKSFVSFDSAPAVGAYFGTQSEEYYRAVFYFSFISKSITSPESIQFARWVNAAVAPRIYSIGNTAPDYNNWTSINDGSFILTMGSSTFTLSSLDFTAVASLTDVASVVQTAIRAEIGGGALWTSATVTYNSLTGGFDLVGGATGAAAISVAAPLSGFDITVAAFLGWLPQSVNTNGNITPGAIWAIGADIETISETLNTSFTTSNNFGTFGFLTNLSLSNPQIVEAAQWNFALNNMFMYSVGVTPSNASALQALLVNIGGVGLTLSPALTPLQYPEMAPMMIAAATNYDAANSVQNYMFQLFSALTPSVSDDTDANGYDALKINYYGVTQQAGSQIAFYQRGSLLGPTTSPQGMNVYMNEVWLKDAASAAVLTMLLAETQIPANQEGRSILLGTLQAVVNAALNNGTIIPNKTLTPQQISFINGVTRGDTAWRQVQGIGYWLDATIVPVGSSYEAQYTLIYSKNDVINFVSGTHALI
jgi:hypothetical protein